MANIRAIHITIMLSVVAHGALLFELGGLSSAGKLPMAQASPVIYIEASLDPTPESVQPENEQQPDSPPEPETLIRPEDTTTSSLTERIENKRIVKREKSVKPVSTATQPAAPLQQASIASIIETRQSYILQVLERIEEQKSYPLQARRRRTSGSVTLSIRVSSSGLIEQLECRQGPASLCLAAVKSTEKAQPFPILPEGTNHLAFEYQMLYKLH